MPGSVADDEERAEVRTFLIADVRGYTRFTQTRGDEAAAALAARFAAVVQEIVEQRDGRLLELRGDEALVVFTSPRQAVRCALELQSRFVDETVTNPELPLGVGVGVDAGEAIPVRGGYRGAALNLAARLCSTAQAGQVLASGEVTHLARRIDGIRYVDRGRAQFKGIDQPVQVVAVVPEGTDPTRRQDFLDAIHPPDIAVLARRRRDRRRRLTVAAAAAALLVADLVVVVDRSTRETALPAIGANAVGRLDVHSGVLHARVPVGAGASAVAADSTSVWVANGTDGTVSRIALASPQAPANTIPVGRSPASIALGAGSVWVADAASRSVARINPKSLTVVDTIPVGNAPEALTYGFGLLWVANTLDDSVSVIDPGAPGGHAVVATIEVGAQPSAIAVGFGSVWVSDSGSDVVSRIDPRSKSVVAAIPVGNTPEGLVADPTGMWVTNALDGTVTHISATSNAVVATVTVGAQPSGIATSGGSLWVANSNSDSVSRINPERGRVDKTIAVGSAPQAAVVAGGDVWVTAQGSAREHLGGTLRVIAERGDVETLDPGGNSFNFGPGLLSVVYDGLLTFRRTVGAAGAQVVPDLAVGLPTVSDSGRTYTFQLRAGIRYSDGSAVHAADVRSSLERMLRIAPSEVTGYYAALVGADSCTRSRCDLSRAVITDDTAGTVVIHLSRPDPNLLSVLGLSFASVVPASTPIRDLGTGLPPHGTGPYVVTSASALHARLARNRYFRVWSPIAQPAGYPDAIDVTFSKGGNGQTYDQNVQAVAHGGYDWTPDYSQDQVAQLVRTKTDQVHPHDISGLHFYFLNTTLPPFDDVRVRRAVNLAIDRAKVVDAVGGPLAARASCQALPTTIYGYRPYCPYTLHPQAAAWSAPDLSAARQLVRAAGAVGAPVRVLARPDHPEIATVVVQAMRSIGLRATLVRFPARGDRTADAYFAYVALAKNHVQTGLFGWGVDFLSPANVFQPLLGCAADQPTSRDNIDAALFCDHGLDAVVARAAALQDSDPSSALATWAAADRRATDAAPWVFLYTDRTFDIVSTRLGNYQYNPQYGMLIDQAWVQ